MDSTATTSGNKDLLNDSQENSDKPNAVTSFNISGSSGPINTVQQNNFLSSKRQRKEVNYSERSMSQQVIGEHDLLNDSRN
jgi:hypothetical protein